MRIQAADLRQTVNSILDDYAEDVSAATDKAVTNTAADAVKQLKKGPQGPKKFKDREYSKGWTKKVIKHRLYSEAVVYNRTKGHLTPLLEFGHALSNGGRATAYPHIAPVNDEVPDIFEEQFQEALNENQ